MLDGYRNGAHDTWNIYLTIKIFIIITNWSVSDLIRFLIKLWRCFCYRCFHCPALCWRPGAISLLASDNSRGAEINRQFHHYITFYWENSPIFQYVGICPYRQGSIGSGRRRGRRRRWWNQLYFMTIKQWIGTGVLEYQFQYFGSGFLLQCRFQCYRFIHHYSHQGYGYAGTCRKSNLIYQYKV